MSGPIAVTGATGAVGSRVAQRLAERGLSQRLVVRDPGRAPRLAGAEVRAASGYGATGEMRAALEGAETLFLVPAHESPDRVAQHMSAIDAAVTAGVRRIVYLSFAAAAPQTTFTFGRDHWATEQHLRETGVPWTFLRMNLYLDFIPGMVGPDGVLRGPAGDGRLAAILRDDVADAAAVVLANPTGHDGRSYVLSGREAFSLEEAAELMARCSGKPIRFVDETEEDAYASRAGYGAPEWEVRGWVSSYVAIRDGTLAAVSDDVLELTGHEPVTLAAWLAAHPECLAHVRGA
jgi:NAD(P)H dehydrogenase (quinone)